MKRQAVNPFLPLNEYIPDGEPHVVGNRVYLFGSHDKEAGETFCMLDYMGWSAPVDDLGNWTCSGSIYSAKQAYNYYFVKDGKIQAPRQAPMVRALALGLLSEEDAIKVAADLNQNAIDRNYTVGTGFLSTPFVLGVLAKHGYVDTAYKMLENTKAPGWLAMVEQGATTVWEVYHIFDEQGHPKASSMNHYSPGAVCAFLFDTVCGINVTGENHFSIAPIPGGTLTHASASYDSPYGMVESGWQRNSNGTVYQITIPAGCTAQVVLPSGKTQTLTAGHYEMEEVNV